MNNCLCKTNCCSLSLENQVLTGQLVNQLSLEGKITSLESISGTVSNLKNYPTYNGVTEITPVVDLDILLETQNTVVKDNIIIHEIPYYETSNLSGGYTVIIG